MTEGSLGCEEHRKSRCFDPLSFVEFENIYMYSKITKIKKTLIFLFSSVRKMSIHTWRSPKYKYFEFCVSLGLVDSLT